MQLTSKLPLGSAYRKFKLFHPRMMGGIWCGAPNKGALRMFSTAFENPTPDDIFKQWLEFLNFNSFIHLIRVWPRTLSLFFALGVFLSVFSMVPSMPLAWPKAELSHTPFGCQELQDNVFSDTHVKYKTNKEISLSYPAHLVCHSLHFALTELNQSLCLLRTQSLYLQPNEAIP